MQEEIEQKSISLATQAGKMTGRTLAQLMQKVLRQMQQSGNQPKQGRQTIKDLAKGGPLEEIEITNKNIKGFERVARKYGMSYSLYKNDAVAPPRWVVLFHARDTSTMTAAFKEYSAQVLKRQSTKASVRDTMEKFKQVLGNAVRSKTRHKQREGPER